MFGRTAEKRDIIEKFTRSNYFTHAAPARRHAFFARFYAVARVRRRNTMIYGHAAVISDIAN